MKWKLSAFQSWDLPLSPALPPIHRAACTCLSSFCFCCDFFRMSAQALYALLSYCQHLAKCVAHFCYKIRRKGQGRCQKLKQGLGEKNRPELSPEQVQFELSESEVLVGHPCHPPPLQSTPQRTETLENSQGTWTRPLHVWVWRAKVDWICTRGRYERHQGKVHRQIFRERDLQHNLVIVSSDESTREQFYHLNNQRGDYKKKSGLLLFEMD